MGMKQKKALMWLDFIWLSGCPTQAQKQAKNAFFVFLGCFCAYVEQPHNNQIRVVAFNEPQLTQASFLQKNQTLQNVFLIYVLLRWHRASVACKNQSF